MVPLDVEMTNIENYI